MRNQFKLSGVVVVLAGSILGWLAAVVPLPTAIQAQDSKAAAKKDSGIAPKKFMA